MSKSVFKTTEYDDGTTVLWYSSGGKLMKVTVYLSEQLKSLSEEDIDNIMKRDGAIFIRGLESR